MGATVIDGNALAEELSEHVHQELTAEDLLAGAGLATILVGEDDAAAAYERHVRRLAERLGCEYTNEHLPVDSELADVLAVVGKLNADLRHRHLVLRLPAGISEPLVYRALDPYKDVEAVHPENAAACWRTEALVRALDPGVVLLPPGFVPARPGETRRRYAGMTLVVVGRSDSVEAGGVARTPAERHGGHVPLPD